MMLKVAAILCVAFVALPTSRAGECTASEFEARHIYWSPACVAQWLRNVHVPDYVADHFETQGIKGEELRFLNDTQLMVPASEGGLNVTEQDHRGKIIDGAKRLEHSEPTDSTDSGLYLPLMVIGTFALVYIMAIKDTQFERQVKNWTRKLQKRVQPPKDPNVAAGKSDWLVGTSASTGSATKRKKAQKK